MKRAYCLKVVCVTKERCGQKISMTRYGKGITITYQTSLIFTVGLNFNICTCRSVLCNELSYATCTQPSHENSTPQPDFLSLCWSQDLFWSCEVYFMYTECYQVATRKLFCKLCNHRLRVVPLVGKSIVIVNIILSQLCYIVATRKWYILVSLCGNTNVFVADSRANCLYPPKIQASHQINLCITITIPSHCDPHALLGGSS